MRKLFLLLLLVIAVFISRPLWEDKVSPYADLSFMDTISDRVLSVIETPNISNALETFTDTITAIIVDIDDAVQQAPRIQSDEPAPSVEKPDLSIPTEQVFSIYNIKLGDSRDQVEQELGEPARQSQNEFGSSWYAYHENFGNFVMVSYNEDGLVNGLFTNQDLITSSIGVTLESSKENVRKELGDPLTTIRKGLIRYQLQNDGEYDVYQVDDAYATIFYDKHEDYTVTAVQIIHESLESERTEIYTEPSDSLKQGFEYQLFDLTNAARVEHGQSVLTWDEQVRETARKHSLDMAENSYFDHTNLNGQSPFDRMKEDGVSYRVAGENLAYGQFSSIYAHEGLMNSLGHRENILKPEFGYLGVGVAFNDDSQPYFTENFFNK
ncbi:CAP-associated domain-containing protein [Jeotgalibacillus proteolyticus]|uniref:Serine protease n=1 Tax=Jeotgalibacillus proteolyticus TaxID=2082395 RepID=A0A2S5GA54_9BACL|nr:CAP-associated domain-containing protein [Jeotgalibacillus proteolyticus]PPA69870.1 serine protease [Jeotgalibacillus proteolyticus]